MPLTPDLPGSTMVSGPEETLVLLLWIWVELMFDIWFLAACTCLYRLESYSPPYDLVLIALESLLTS